MTVQSCPNCGTTEGDAIWGHQDNDVYDGVLFWSCGRCGHAWPRKWGIERRDQASRDQARRFMDARAGR